MLVSEMQQNFQYALTSGFIVRRQYSYSLREEQNYMIMTINTAIIYIYTSIYISLYNYTISSHKFDNDHMLP